MWYCDIKSLIPGLRNVSKLLSLNNSRWTALCFQVDRSSINRQICLSINLVFPEWVALLWKVTVFWDCGMYQVILFWHLLCSVLLNVEGLQSFLTIIKVQVLLHWTSCHVTWLQLLNSMIVQNCHLISFLLTEQYRSGNVSVLNFVLHHLRSVNVTSIILIFSNVFVYWKMSYSVEESFKNFLDLHLPKFSHSLYSPKFFTCSDTLLVKVSWRFEQFVCELDHRHTNLLGI